MGCSGSALRNPTPENICNPDGDTIGDLIDVQEACFFTTEIGKYCDQPDQKCFGAAFVTSGEEEWVPAGPGEGCGVCSSCKGAEQGTGNGLCGYGTGSCSWAGVRQRCQRIATRGDPLKCCRRNQAEVGNLFCFDDNTKNRTCPNEFRGFSTTGCIGVMGDYCANDDEELLQNKWTGTAATKDCLRYVQENIGKLDNYGPVIAEMVSEYLLTRNKPITSSSAGNNHDPFIDEIVKICRENPGACDAVLTAKCSDTVRDDLSNNVNLANLCGCFMPDVQYAKYSQFGIERVCDPVCTIGTSVKPLDTTTSNPAQFQRCKQSICVIDNVMIDILAQSSVGDINFSQACGNCSDDGNASCRCYITDINISSINSKVGDINFDQACGGTPLCYKSPTEPGAPLIEVDCITGDTVNKSGGKSGNYNSAPLWIALGVLLFIIILILIFVLTSRRKKFETDIVIPPTRKTTPLLGQANTTKQPRGLLAAN